MRAHVWLHAFYYYYYYILIDRRILWVFTSHSRRHFFWFFIVPLSSRCADIVVMQRAFRFQCCAVIIIMQCFRHCAAISIV